MNSIIDTLFLRRPRLEYVSPAICEALFSSSSEPTIVLAEISRYRGPTGIRLGGVGRNTFLGWDRTVGVLCYNIYRTPSSIDPNGIYTVVSECVPENSIFVCSAGTFYLTVNRPDGETAPGPDFVCDGNNPLIVPLPQVPNTISYNLYKNGVLYWAAFDGMAYEICEPGCYKVSGISPDGETDLSDPACFECTEEVACIPSQIFDWDLCQCVVCPELECPPGEQWEAESCSCQPAPPPPMCSPFIDLFGNSIPTDVATNGVGVMNTGGGNYSKFVGRVLTTHLSAEVENGTVYFVDAAGGVVGDFAGASNQTFYRNAAGVLTKWGPNYFTEAYNLQGLSEERTVAIQRVVGGTINRLEFSKDGVVLHTISAGDDVRMGYRQIGPAGHALYSIDNPPTQDLYMRNPDNSSTNLSMDAELGVPRACINLLGWAAYVRLWKIGAVVQTPELYFWNGSSNELVASPGGTIYLGGDNYGSSGMNATGTIVWRTAAGAPYKWTPLGGAVSLGLPGGAASVSKIFVDDEGLIYAVANTGVFYYWNNLWGPASDIFPISATLWSDITELYEVTRDGHVTGRGTYNGNAFTFFLAKCCPPT